MSKNSKDKPVLNKRRLDLNDKLTNNGSRKKSKNLTMETTDAIESSGNNTVNTVQTRSFGRKRKLTPAGKEFASKNNNATVVNPVNNLECEAIMSPAIKIHKIRRKDCKSKGANKKKFKNSRGKRQNLT